MTCQEAEAILLKSEVKIAFRHRFAGDKGTIIRLDNYAMINIFDDGRYYIQGQNTEELIELFSQVETPWDPETWDGKIGDLLVPWLAPRETTPTKRFEP